MDAPVLHALAKEHLLPLFSGAELDINQFSSTSREECVALYDPCTIEFKIHRQDAYRLRLRRSQAFGKLRHGRVTEKHVVSAFVEVLKGIEPGLAAPYRLDLLSTFQRRIVAKATASNAEAEAPLLTALDQMAKWATRLYEGKSISAAIGLVPNVVGTNATLKQICEHDFSAVLSNGFDTLLTFDFQGHVLSHESLPQPNPIPSYAPYRQAALAQWADSGKIVVALNRLGEILIFQDQMLLFVRRSGKWNFLTHEPVVTQMKRPYYWAVRKGVYETCLDASFARTGACIGVVTSPHIGKWTEIATSKADYLSWEQSPKARAISRMIGQRCFEDLDRRFRQELVAIDGATLLDGFGNVLAVGAILKIPGGSTGGGRLAAARALSTLGLGIKVSQDGGIVGFHDGVEKPIFQVM